MTDETLVLEKAQIDVATDTEYDYVEVPEWTPADSLAQGIVGKVRIRNLFGDQRQKLYGLENSHCWNALCCTMGIVDRQGANVYAEANAPALSRKHPEVLERIAKRICDLSNMTKASREAAEKKLLATKTNSGGSGSPAESTPASGSTLTPSSEPPPALSLNDGSPTTA